MFVLFVKWPLEYVLRTLGQLPSQPVIGAAWVHEPFKLNFNATRSQPAAHADIQFLVNLTFALRITLNSYKLFNLGVFGKMRFTSLDYPV